MCKEALATAEEAARAGPTHAVHLTAGWRQLEPDCYD
jgi:hypothetical protein